MEDIDSPPLCINPRKRAAADEDTPEKKTLNLKGTQFMMPTPPDTDQFSNSSPTGNEDSATRECSPAPSSTTLSSCATLASNPLPAASTTIDLTSSHLPASTSEGPPKKKRKLTPAEKEEQKREKETKAAEKAAEKARKDAEKAADKARKEEEKARKDEEKRIRDEAKRKKAEENEAKKRAKELKEEEEAQKKVKKEQSQLRLGVFFPKPSTPAKAPGMSTEEDAPCTTARRKSLSLEPFDAVAGQIRRSESPCKAPTQPKQSISTPLKTVVSDYKKCFLPFQLQTHTTMPDVSLPEDLNAAQEAFDYEIEDPSLQEKYDLGLVDSYASLERLFAIHRHSRGINLPSMRQLMERIQGSIELPVDLTSDETPLNPMDELQIVARRHIEFQEDVRPVYFGTYTKIKSPKSSRRLSRNPFMRSRPDTDYDYDSEAEWEDDADEGEDLLDEDDNEAESICDAHEFDEFLDDDEDEPKKKRKLITGDLVPVSTGLCWEDESGKIVSSIEGSSPCLNDMRIGVLLPGFTGRTIDPFSTAYWESDLPPAQDALATKIEKPIAQTSELMPPPRPPLQTRPSGNGTLDHLLAGARDRGEGPGIGAAPTQTSKTPRKSAPKPLSSEDMEEFKGCVVGSTSTKADILKELKARFPKLTNETIKVTLNDNFAQVGASKAEKKWGYVSIS